MAKWADYAISRVRYNSMFTHIDSVEVADDSETFFGTQRTETRATVVFSLTVGRTYVSVPLSSDGNITKGASVGLVTVNGVTCNRTDSNSMGSDKLEKLPAF